MCSVTSATDQRSGPGLKFHCASDNPAVASSTPCLVLSRYFMARSRSAWVNDCEYAEIETYSTTAITVKSRFIVFVPFVVGRCVTQSRISWTLDSDGSPLVAEEKRK